MPPKKQAKKEVIQEPPKPQEPQIPPHELQGYGRFEYVNGIVYEGSWRLFEGIKMKHGEGILVVPGLMSNSQGEERYEGSWVKDQMQGYGCYTYAGGGKYRGQWKNNRQQGRGEYEFPNGTIYEGEWRNHLMHGSGYYVDAMGKKWQGQFRNGKFQTRLQKELMKEKQKEIKKQVCKQAVIARLNAMQEALSKSDKKTFKDNFSVFFASGDIIKTMIKEPYSKFDERPIDKWTQLIGGLKEAVIRVLQFPEQTEVLTGRILSRQMEGVGQVVELAVGKDGKQYKGAFVNIEGELWMMVLASM